MATEKTTVKEETKFMPLSEIHADFDWNSRHKSFREEEWPYKDEDGNIKCEEDGKTPVAPSAGTFWSLRKSIEQVGQDTPLIVRPSTKGKKPYELVAGFRRFEAIRQIADAKINYPVPQGVQSSPANPMVKVEIRNLDDKEARALNGRENIERENLETWDQAFIVMQMSRQENMSDLAIAAQTGMSNGHISQLRRITEGLHPEVFEQWRSDPLLQQISLDKLEKSVAKLVDEKDGKKAPNLKSQQIAVAEFLETKPSRGGNKGKWVEVACRQADAIGTLLGALEFSGRIDCSRLNLKSIKHVQELVAGDILVIKGKDGTATDKQWEKIAEAAHSAYELAKNPPEEEEEEEEEEETKGEPKTGTRAKNKAA